MTAPIRILLVEDNPGDVELTRETLAGGTLAVELTVVLDGAEALDYLYRRGRHADAYPPDLILLDLQLPRLDGREVLDAMARDDTLRRIPVVVLSSSDAQGDILACYALGASCYLQKPVDLAEFQAVVHAIEAFWFAVVRSP